MGRQITERGIGNGISLLIFAGIAAGLPSAVGQSLEQARQGELNILVLLGIVALAIVGGVSRGLYRARPTPGVTVNYAKRQQQGRQQYQAQSFALAA